MSSAITMYTTTGAGIAGAQALFEERGIAFREVDIDNSPEAEELVLRVNDGRRRAPTLEIDGRYFANSPFDPYKLAEELKIPLNS